MLMGACNNDDSEKYVANRKSLNLHPFKLYSIYLDPLSLSKCSYFPGLYPGSKRERKFIAVCLRPP